MTTTTYCKEFEAHREAMSWARVKTNAHRNGDRAVFVVVPGPSDNFAVVDLETGIDLGLGYEFTN
jgi:hypothetical protein